jgi:hypothetical protein
VGSPPPADFVPSPGNPLPPAPGTVSAFATVTVPTQGLNYLSDLALEAQAEVANAVALANAAATQALLLVRLAVNPNFNLAAVLSFSTPSFEICGFGIPKITFAFALNLQLGFLFQFPPAIFLRLQLPCGFALQVSLPSGGGRSASPLPEFGAEFALG